MIRLPISYLMETKQVLARRLTPILNVSDIAQGFAWCEQLGWQQAWAWGEPPDFGGVCSGECEIFLCRGTGEE